MRPGQGRIVERECTPDDRAALDEKTQARRLPSPQEMAILPRARCLGEGADAGGSAVLCGDDEEDWGDIAGELYVMSER